ncbi:M20/M25/M40 family metallo-hydrolase [Schumannella soli]|uniref:M20/M25/M40 family metallo-hydrolase n=1 Tax=Schumannella soli TaxID=2590779 RepID=A0A506XSI4_9MICO|nr:M20/M25/M40 family metallo-hydrolase [Schumannella soli]TPW75714.1 M20/M25/M40 family metallo-hydrolase [Schumannella soli]
MTATAASAASPAEPTAAPSTAAPSASAPAESSSATAPAGLSEAAVALLEREALDIARQLVRIDSSNTGEPGIGDGETRAALLIRELLTEVGIASEFAESRPGRGNLVARIPGADPEAPALLVHGHLDVVPADADDWTHPPFAAEIADGLLYGRGVVDMKGFVGTVVAVVRAFAREGVQPRRELVLAFFADEEAGGVWGARWVVAEHPEWLAGATEALGEVGGFSLPLAPPSDQDGSAGTPGAHRAYLVSTAEKGVSSIVLTARGPAGHGSRPSADNAVTRLARAVARIADHRFPVVRTPSVEALLATVGAALGEDLTALDDDALEARLAGLGLLGTVVAPSLRHTASPTILQAGYKSNVIPGEASARIDCRILPGHEEAFFAELDRLAGPGIEIDKASWIPPIDSPADSPLLTVLQESIRAEDPDGTVVPYLMPASTDNKHVAALGIRGYGFTPLRVPADVDVLGLFHAADERVPVESIAFGARVLADVLSRA